MSSFSGCPFCSDDGAIIKNEHTYARFDKYPVNPGHALVIPRYKGDIPNPRGGVRGVIPS